MAKLPDDIQEIIKRKQEYIDSNRSKLESNVIKLQEALLNRFIEEILPQLETENGNIKSTSNNMRLIEKLDALYQEFNATNQTKVVKELGESLLRLNTLNSSYFKKITAGEQLKGRFDSVINKTNDLMSARLGVGKDGKITKGSYLDSFITDNTLLTELKQSIVSNVTGQQTIEKFRKDIRDKIVGNSQQTGGFEKYYRQFAYDTYSQYDRAYGKNVADEFGLNYAIYQGGLIDDSRDFCKEHQSKVYTREEIKQFGKWKLPEDTKEYPGPGEVPSYIAKFPNYDPFTNLGGFSCRHQLTWIPKSYAERLRPDLKVTEEKTIKTPIEVKTGLSIEDAKKEMKALNISDSHKKVLSGYTGEKFNQINQYLGGQRKEVPENIKDDINNLSEFLNSAPKVSAVSYRGKKGDRAFNEFKSLKVGSVYSEKAFMSTTYDKETANSFADGPYNKVLMTINGKSGVLVEEYSDARTEKEILFNKGSKYKVSSIKTEKVGKFSKILVSLEEI